MRYYIVDTTLQPRQVKEFADYPSLVGYLNGLVERAFGQSRKRRMLMLEGLGHGYDDRDSVTFVRSMADKFEMGIIRDEAGSLRKIKCDIPSIALYQKEEFGN